MMRPYWPLGAFALLLGVPDAVARERQRVPEVAAVTSEIEQLELSGVLSRPKLRADVLAGTVDLTVPRAELPALHRALTRRPSAACPEATLHPAFVRLRCRQRRVEVVVTRERGALGLEVRALRGLPWRGDIRPPTPAYPPLRAGLGEPCPGTVDVVRAECALARGERSVARELFTKAAKGPSLHHAHLRLGDLAVDDEDPATAAEHYAKAGKVGYVGRLAAERLCDLTGACDAYESARAINLAHLPEPMRTETELRGVFRSVFDGEPGDAAEALLSRLVEPGREPACSFGFELCRRVTLWTLRDEVGGDRTTGLRLYLALPASGWRYTDVELARAAADAAESVGAPLYGAHALSMVTGSVKANELDAHLRDLVRLFTQGGDTMRAQVIDDYARSRLGDQAVGSRQWTDARKPYRRPSPPPPKPVMAPKLVEDTAADRIMAEALVTLGRARASAKSAP